MKSGWHLFPLLVLAITPAPVAARAEQMPTFSDEQRAALDAIDLADLFARVHESPAVRQPRIEAVGALLKHGNRVEEWSKSGINIASRIQASELEFGPAYLLERSTETISISYNGEPQALLGPSYVRHALFERPVSGKMESGLFGLFPGIWLEIYSATQYVDHAMCNAGVARAAILADRPVSRWSEEELGSVLFLAGMMLDIADAKVCLVYDEVDDGGYRSRAFLSDGTELPALRDRGERLEIVSRKIALDFLREIETRPTAP